MKQLLILVLCLFFMGCGVRVGTSRGFMGPDVYYATDGKIEVRYYNGECCCVAKKVLENLAEKANSGVLDWDRMNDKEFQEKVLKDECNRLRAKH